MRQPMTVHQLTRGLGAGLIGVSLVISAGCSPESLVERAVENRLEAETGTDVDLDFDGDGLRVDSEDGSFEMDVDEDGSFSMSGGEDGEEFSLDASSSEDGELPDDLPDIPLPSDFATTFSQTMSGSEGTAWTLSGTVPANLDEIRSDYLGALESAGFERTQITESAEALIFTYSDGQYQVSGFAGPDGDGSQLNLTISEPSS